MPTMLFTSFELSARANRLLVRLPLPNLVPRIDLSSYRHPGRARRDPSSSFTHGCGNMRDPGYQVDPSHCVRRRRTLPNFVGVLWTLAKVGFLTGGQLWRHILVAQRVLPRATQFLSSSRTSGVGGRVVEEFRSCCCFFIWYVHEHDRLGFEMWIVETAAIHLMFILIVPIATEKVSRIRSNIIWNRWKSTLRARSIWVNLNQGKEM